MIWKKVEKILLQIFFFIQKRGKYNKNILKIFCFFNILIVQNLMLIPNVIKNVFFAI